MGDMNINLLKCQVHPKTNDYLDNLFSRGFLPVITKPTRVCNSSVTLIDHIYTNHKVTNHSSGIVISDLADHFGTYLSIVHKLKIDFKSTFKFRCVSTTNIAKFKENLNAIDFSHISNIQCANTAYNEFIDIYRAEFENTFPLKTERKKGKFIKNEPWVTNGLVTSSRNKNELFKAKLLNPTELNIARYKNFNRLLTKLMRTAKTHYYSQLIEENKFNMKKMWQILNKTIGKHNDKSTFPGTFIINNRQLSDKSKIAEGFNKYFSEIGKKNRTECTCFNTYIHSLLARSSCT